MSRTVRVILMRAYVCACMMVDISGLYIMFFFLLLWKSVFFLYQIEEDHDADLRSAAAIVDCLRLRLHSALHLLRVRLLTRFKMLLVISSFRCAT